MNFYMNFVHITGVTSCAVSEIIGSYTRGLYRLDLRREANIRMADDEAHRDLKLNKRRPEVGRDIDDRDGNMDSNQQDIDDSGVGNEAGEEETEDLKRAVRKKTEDDHRQDINDPWVLGTRPGGTEAKKKTKDEMTTKTDTKVKETIARVQVGNGAMTSGQPKEMIKRIRRDRLVLWGSEDADFFHMSKSWGRTPMAMAPRGQE